MAIRVAITFDAEHGDQPSRYGVQEELLEVLASRGVACTFFVQGRWAEAFPETARRIAGDGHLVGNHSYYHARMPLLTDDGIANDVRSAETAIRDVLGSDPRPWFRLPFGAGANDPRVLGRLAAVGYRDVGWDVDPTDWSPDRTVDQVVTDVVDKTIERGDGAIVLMHTWPAVTVAALPRILDGLRAAEVRFVKVDELLTGQERTSAAAPWAPVSSVTPVTPGEA